MKQLDGIRAAHSADHKLHCTNIRLIRLDKVKHTKCYFIQLNQMNNRIQQQPTTCFWWHHSFSLEQYYEALKPQTETFTFNTGLKLTSILLSEWWEEQRLLGKEERKNLSIFTLLLGATTRIRSVPTVPRSVPTVKSKPNMVEYNWWHGCFIFTEGIPITNTQTSHDRRMCLNSYSITVTCTNDL